MGLYGTAIIKLRTNWKDLLQLFHSGAVKLIKSDHALGVITIKTKSHRFNIINALGNDRRRAVSLQIHAHTSIYKGFSNNFFLRILLLLVWVDNYRRFITTFMSANILYSDWFCSCFSILLLNWPPVIITTRFFQFQLILLISARAGYLHCSSLFRFRILLSRKFWSSF